MENNKHLLSNLKFSGNENENKKIKIYIDVINEKLVFEGHYKTKLGGITQWHLIAVFEFDLNKSNFNFEEVIENLNQTMNKRIQFIELSKTYLKNVDIIEINDVEKPQNNDKNK